MYRSEIDNNMVELFVSLVMNNWRQESDIPEQIKWRVIEALETKKFGQTSIEEE